MPLWDGGHGGPPKTSHSHICVTTAAQFGCSSLKSVVIDREEPQNLGALGYALWGGGVADPLKQAPPYMCYHVKFGTSASNGICINRRKPQNWGALGPVPLRSWHG